MKIKRCSTTILSVLSLFCLMQCSPKIINQIEEDAWPSFRGNLLNQGNAPTHLQSPLVLSMVHEASDKIRATVAANGEEIFFADWTGAVQSIDIVSGEQRWKAMTGGFITGSPALVADRLIVGSCDKSIYAFSMRNGKRLWKFQTGEMVITSPAIFKNLAIIGSSDGCIYGLNWKNGKKKWRRCTESIITSSAALYKDRVYIGTTDPSLLCLRAKDGEPLWLLPTEKGVAASPMIAENTVFFGDWAGVFRAVNPDSGKVLWEMQCPAKIDASAAYANGKVFWTDMAGTLYAAIAATGEPVWQAPLGSAAISSVVVDAEHVYVARNSGAGAVRKPGGRVFMFRQRDGELMWSFGLEGRIYASPIIFRGRLIIGTEGGKLYAFQAELEGGK